MKGKMEELCNQHVFMTEPEPTNAVSDKCQKLSLDILDPRHNDFP
jgi:hypothetical protein